jgi:hypothetical protein
MDLPERRSLPDGVRRVINYHAWGAFRGLTQHIILVQEELVKSFVFETASL